MQKNRFEMLKGKIPYLNCPLREYEEKTIAECVKIKLNNSESFHITFIGDSRVRNLMEVLLEVMASFQLTITTSKVVS